MATPDFILALREKIGTAPLWLSGVTAVVVRPAAGGERGGSDEDPETVEVLLVKRADNGAWTPVTGIIDPGEEPAVAAAREVLEEADVTATPVRLARVGVTATSVYPNGDRSRFLDLTFRCDFVSGTPFPADGENTEAAWFALDALPEMSDDMLERLDAALDDTPEARFAS